MNCAHCHNPDGPAHTSGLDLRWNATPAIAWGVGKRPIAAGRGSAGMEFAIEPGHPERSFLLYRMESLDPGVMMPELGRQLVDDARHRAHARVDRGDGCERRRPSSP